MWWCSYASESACLIVVVHTLRYLVLQPTDVRPVLCYVCVRTLTLRLNIMACITPGLHMGTAMHVCAHARLWQRLCCDTMYPHVLCVCVCARVRPLPLPCALLPHITHPFLHAPLPPAHPPQLTPYPHTSYPHTPIPTANPPLLLHAAHTLPSCTPTTPTHRNLYPAAAIHFDRGAWGWRQMFGSQQCILTVAPGACDKCLATSNAF